MNQTNKTDHLCPHCSHLGALRHGPQAFPIKAGRFLGWKGVFFGPIVDWKPGFHARVSAEPRSEACELWMNVCWDTSN